MTDLPQRIADIQEELRSARQQLASLEETLAQARDRENVIREELRALPPNVFNPQRVQLQRQLARLQVRIRDLESKRTQQIEQIVHLEELLASLVAEQALLGQLGALPSTDLPLALLPVRLQTRFVPTDQGVDLLVRVFPDHLHVDAHEPGLTEEEEVLGKRFWEQSWRSGDGSMHQRGAWAQLAARYGPARASWLVQALTPVNLQDRPSQPVEDEDPSVATPQFPGVNRRADTWTRAAHSRLVPDRWVALGYRDGQRVLTIVGAPVPDPLPVGPDPAADAPLVDFGRGLPVVDEGMAWVVDFATAERVGMGLRATLTTEEAQLGFDRLIVLGLKNSLDGEAGAQRLEEALVAQHYTDGLGFVLQGTPSNNTAEASSGYGSGDPGFEASYHVQFEQPVFSPDANAVVAARALGINPQVFARREHADKEEQAGARHMNAALWPVTGGYFLTQMMADHFSADVVAQGRRHFIDHVRARGPLPVLRAGSQPYGLLPVSSLDRWRSLESPTSTTSFIDILRMLRSTWRQAASQVARVEAHDDPDQAEEDLLQILSLEANAIAYTGRPVLDRAFFGIPRIPASQSALPPEVQARQLAARKVLEEMGLDWRPRLIEAVLMERTFLLPPPLTQVAGQDSSNALRPNFIRWLMDSDYAAIRDEIYDSEEFPSDRKLASLLYLLMRHATLLTYAETAFRIQLSAGVLTSDAGLEPALVDVFREPPGKKAERTRTVGRHVEHELPGLVGKPVHQLKGSDHPEAVELEEFRDGLEYLQTLEPATLEQLMVETLDLVSYRLDPWITSLAGSRLHQLRLENPTGIHLGSYGWVENLRPAPRQVAAPPDPGLGDGPLWAAQDDAGFVHGPSMAHASTAAILRTGYLSHEGQPGSHPFATNLSSERIRRAQWLLDGMRQGQTLAALLGYRFERGLHDGRLDRYIAPFRRLAPLGELNKLRAALADAEAALEQVRTQLAAELRIARRGLAMTQQQLESLQSERDRLPDRLDRATAQLARVEQAVTGASQEVQRLTRAWIKTGQKPPKPQRLERAEKRLAGLLEQRKEALDALEALRDRKRTIDGEIKAAQVQVNKARARLQALTRRQATDLEPLEEAVTVARGRLEDQLVAFRQRHLFPPTADMVALESTSSTSVLDGLVLLRLWQDQAIPFGRPGRDLPAPGSEDHKLLVAELEDLETTVDALADAIMAESVYQLVRGHPERAGATFDAISRGEAPPPELEVVGTPRSGIGLTHRVMLLFSGAGGPAAAWPINERQVRAHAEPHLNRWAGRLLGRPSNVRCRAAFVDPETNQVLASLDLRLDELAMSPLDFLFLAGGVDGNQLASLEKRLAHHLMRTRPVQVPPGAQIRLTFDRAEDWPADHLAVDEFLEVASAIRQAILNGRPLDPRDLADPGGPAAGEIDLDELGERANRVVSALRVAHGRLRASLDLAEASPATADPLALDAGLLALSYFGLPETVPPPGAAETEAGLATLLSLAEAACQRVERQLGQIEAIERDFEPGAATVDATVAHHRARLHIALGPAFPVLPRFRPGNGQQLQEAFDAMPVLLDQDPQAATTWLQRMAWARPAAARLVDALMAGEAVAGKPLMDLLVGQLPLREGERWVALPLKSDAQLAGSRLSLVAQVSEPVDLSAFLAGLVVDEWAEVVPNERETTAVAFHFDEPGAQPPQVVLLAISPDDSSQWSLEALEATVLETLELARLRAVDPQRLFDSSGLGQFLPALYIALNPKGDTVSTDFTRAAS